MQHLKGAVRHRSYGLSFHVLKWEEGRKSNFVPSLSNVAPEYNLLSYKQKHAAKCSTFSEEIHAILFPGSLLKLAWSFQKGLDRGFGRMEVQFDRSETEKQK